MNSSKIIYLDNNSTTKIDSRVLDEMMPFLTDSYGNASSNHEFGNQINQEVKKARNSVAELLGCDPHEVVFTSGATEAINLALKGVVEANPSRNQIITIQTEHKAVLDVCNYLQKKGCQVTYLPVESDGLIDLELLKSHLSDNTLIVSVMLVNNETGVIQPITEIAELAHGKGAFFMTDATQAVGKLPVNVNSLGADLLAFSAHKFYGPKGIGGLFVRSRRPNKVKLEAVLHGGGHERSMRSGTLNVPGIVGLGKACEIAVKEMAKDKKEIEKLRNFLEEELLRIEDTFINGDKQKRLYNTSNICFKGADAHAIISGLKGIMVSNGSACTSSSIEPSHVLIAMGRTDEEAYSSLRISLGKCNSISDIKTFIKSLQSTIILLRQMGNHITFSGS